MNAQIMIFVYLSILALAKTFYDLLLANEALVLNANRSTPAVKVADALILRRF
jgi:carbon starvation protein CstA